MDNTNTNTTPELCLGIDFGTTNSCLSVWYNNKAIIIPDIDGSDVIPTVIEIDSDKKIIGKHAYLRKSIFENETKSIFLVYEIKKILGKKYSELNQKNIELLAYNIQPDEHDNIQIISDDGKIYYPEEIATHLFMSFKLKAELYLSEKFQTNISISKSVISVPAYFNKIQRQTIKNSAEYAGLQVIRLINEPTAASIAYGLGKQNINSNIIVFDFGGGTLDVSLLNIDNGVYSVLGSCGNNNLGGSDFDLGIMKWAIFQFLKSHPTINPDSFTNDISENSIHRLKLLCEQAKISLTTNTSVKIRMENFYNSHDLSVVLTREIFSEITHDLVSIIIKPINDLLEICDFVKSNVDEVIMVGGMTRVPLVRFNIERYFNKDVNCSINPDNVVSIGCAIHGYMLLNGKNIQDGLVLIDRTPLSIGLETTGGIMDVLIKRGQIIPYSITKKYTTDQDYVSSIDIKIFEGERKFTKDNFLIGDFSLSGIEEQKKGVPSIAITFVIDADGIVKITAEDLDNPLNKKSIQVSGNKQNLSKEQIEEIIEKAKSMDQADRIDKMKKESYILLIHNSQKILENVSAPTVKIPPDVKTLIMTNVQEILNWLNSTDYQSIDADKYKELLHDYKTNYSIYLIQQNTPLVELESCNEASEEEKGIDIYDEDVLTKKYVEQIEYFRNIINEYEKIKKHIGLKLADNSVLDEELEKAYHNVYSYASEKLLNFFIQKDLTDQDVDQMVDELYNLDIGFKEIYQNSPISVDVVSELINVLEERESKYLDIMEKLDEENQEMRERVQTILDIIIGYHTELYTMSNGFESVDYDKLKTMKEHINIL